MRAGGQLFFRFLSRLLTERLSELHGHQQVSQGDFGQVGNLLTVQYSAFHFTASLWIPDSLCVFCASLYLHVIIRLPILSIQN
jgi:hypothetical protein